MTGCVKVSEGCDHCYAATFAERWRGVPGQSTHASIRRWGKHRAGRELDGRTWDQMPDHHAPATAATPVSDTTTGR